MLDTLVSTGARQFTRRFLLVSVIPTTLLLLLIFGLFWGGAPDQQPSIRRAVDTATEQYGIRVWLLVLAGIVTSLVLHPLQLRLVRLLEGYWDDWRVGQTVGDLLILRHRIRRRELAQLATIQDDEDIDPEPLTAQRQSERAALLLDRYPAYDRILPTTLGNVLRAAEDFAGDRYGLDATMIWPRLYVVMPSKILTILNDQRVQLDLTAQLCVTMVIGAAVCTWLLLGYGAWLLIPLGLYALAWLSYRAAIAIAIEYGTMMATAIDLYRFDLLEALRIRLPRDRAEELRTNAELCRVLRHEAASAEVRLHLAHHGRSSGLLSFLRGKLLRAHPQDNSPD
jgi:hypothetical protein